ncbi:hypothetical protein I633_14615 [Alteromonas mediterranea 615]|uniref:Polysaccharide pyruvyl transferase domain-containing protein n=1 Tax=Alteromonas mediterranea 615 TaxID=1300253 RepID=S5AIP2_9ALTE|nr:hypothetical protein I633_14615 [Alteromonas mediterranea 615]
MTLEELLKRYREKPFLFVKPGGNWGDDLIYLGAEHLAEELGVVFRTISAEEFIGSSIADEVIYLHGGGGYNPWCTGRAYKCFEHAVSNSKGVVIQGPCTVSVDMVFLQRIFKECLQNVSCHSIFFFAREKTSFGILSEIEEIKAHTQLYLDKDTAFYTNKSKLIKKIGYSDDKYTLHGYRIDNESSNVKSKNDLTKLFIDPAEEAISFDHWLRIHSNAKKIITNRTHSSILGFLLGKETYLFGSKYHKNKSIFEHSMQGGSVVWLDDDQATELSSPSLLAKALPNSLRNSYRLKKALQILRGVPDR